MTNRHLLIFTMAAVFAFSCTGGRTGHQNQGIFADDGLEISDHISNRKVRAFEEDADGHIWIGTFRGLNKYNVHVYHQYFCTDDSLGLPDNQINDIHRDSKGRLWIATVNGTCIRTEDDRFKRIPLQDRNNSYTQILETKSGTILLNSSYTLLKYDEESEKTEVAVPRFNQNGTTCRIAPDGKIWAVSLGSLKRYDPETFQQLDSIPTPIQAYHSCMMSNGELWLSGMGRMAIFDTGSKEYASLPEAISSNRVLSSSDVDLIFAIDDNSILLNTIGKGLFYYYRTTGKLIHQSEPGFPFEVPQFRITQIFRDSQRNIWFGSEDQGYSVSYLYKDQFNNNKFLTSLVENKSVLSVTPDRRSNLWIATSNDGLYVHNLKTNTFREIDLHSLITDAQVGYIQCNTVFVDRQGYVWLLFSNKYRVLRCSYENERIRVLDTFFCNTPITICQDINGNVWIGELDSSLRKYDYASGRMEPVKVLGDEWTFVSAIINDGEELLVGSFNNPVSVVGINDGKPSGKNIFDHPDFHDCIKRSVIIPTFLFKDSTGDIWLGTVANGVIRYSVKDKAFSSVEGLSCIDVSSIQEDRQGNIWISTMNGLCKVARSSGDVLKYYEADGIGGNQFCDRSSCILPDGTLIFGGTHGLTCFNPLDVPQKRSVPLVFEDLKVHNRIVQAGQDAPFKTALHTKPDITIKYNQNGFSISFAALDYCEHERTHYFYMMDGFDSYWVDAGNNYEAYYANLPVGKYKFRVRITNNNQSIEETEESLNLKVLPPPWLAWWAKLIYAIFAAVVLGLFLMVRFRMHSEQKAKELAEHEKSEEKRLNKMQMSFFSNVAHEFRTPLTMISGPVALLGESGNISGQDRNLLGVVQRSVNWMLRLVNQLLDFNKIENDTLRLKVSKTDVIEELNQIGEIFQTNAKAKGIELTSHGLEDSFCMWLDSDKLMKIVMNLMSNALKFTPKGGRVDVSFDVMNRAEADRLFPLTPDDKDIQYAKITVADTGRGIPDGQLEKIFERYYQLNNQETGTYNFGSGIGLYYSRALANLHHGYLKAWNRNDVIGDGLAGAVFSLLLPVSADSYSEMERMPPETDQAKVYPIPAGKSIGITQEPPEGSDQRKLVLVVDDDIDVANYLKILLSPVYRVNTCFDVDSALGSMKEDEPDIVLSDVMMPGKDGFELCRSIKTDLQLSHIPVILVTAKVTVDSQVKGLEQGADAYVTKPFAPDYLLAQLKSQLENRDKLRKVLGSAVGTEEIEGEGLAPQDKAFMNDLYTLMENELSNPELDIARMTGMMKISRTKFYYKVKGLTGENPSVFFKRYKLNRAARLLLEGKNNMSEIADMTGFSTLSHFSTSFKKQFGVPPSEYKG